MLPGNTEQYTGKQVCPDAVASLGIVGRVVCLPLCGCEDFSSSEEPYVFHMHWSCLISVAHSRLGMGRIRSDNEEMVQS